MIVFDLHCAQGHKFEGWFSSSDDFESQRDSGMLACPQCGIATVRKAPMAPAVPAKGGALEPSADSSVALTNSALPAKVQKALETLAKAQAEALSRSRWVGDDFAEQSRAMHYGEREVAEIHGRASLDEARELLDEGIPVAPLPFPVQPPEDLN